MASIRTVIFAYFIGGFTFIPLVIAAIVYYIYTTLPEVDKYGNIISAPVSAETAKIETPYEQPTEQEQERKTAEDLLKSLEGQPDIGVDSYMTGWLTVLREFSFARITGSSHDKSSSLNETAYTSIYKHLIDRKQGSSMATNGSLEPSPDGKPKIKPKRRTPHTFFAILRHGNLFLYDSPEQMNVQQVIVLANHAVFIWPPNVPDGQLYSRRHAVCLAPKSKLPAELDPNDPPRHAYFLFSENCSEKEDFYFAILRASKREARRGSSSSIHSHRFLPKYPDPLIDAHPIRPDEEELSRLMDIVLSDSGNPESNWINALLGRMFFALNKTTVLENFIKSKIDSKLSRVKRPSFLGDISVTKVLCGNSPPYFSNIAIKEFSKSGALTIAADLSYKGDLKLEIATKAKLNLGSHFKSREVSLVLSVAFKSLKGRINFMLKSPPSNRFWYCFETMPEINMVISPVVSSRQITYSMVTRVIENRILENLRDSLVAPFMDDLAFYNSSSDFYRGGIWDHSLRQLDDEMHEEESSSFTEGDSVSDPVVESSVQTLPQDARLQADNISVSSSYSADAIDRHTLYDDPLASASSPELKYRKTDGSLADEDSLRRKRTTGVFAASAPAVVGTDKVSIVVVDGELKSQVDSSETRYTSSSPVQRSHSRSSGTLSARNEVYGNEPDGSTDSFRLDNTEDSKSVKSFDSSVGFRQSEVSADTASERSLGGTGDRATISDSVKKWSTKYFASAKKTVVAKMNNRDSLLSTSNPVRLREDQIQKRIIEARLAQNEDITMNAPKPHTYPFDATVVPDTSDHKADQEAELLEGPSSFAAGPRASSTFPEASYERVYMHLPNEPRVSPVPRRELPLSSSVTANVDHLPVLQPIQPPPISPTRKVLSNSPRDTDTRRESLLAIPTALPVVPPPPPLSAQYSASPSLPVEYASPSFSGSNETVSPQPVPYTAPAHVRSDSSERPLSPTFSSGSQSASNELRRALSKSSSMSIPRKPVPAQHVVRRKPVPNTGNGAMNDDYQTVDDKLESKTVFGASDSQTTLPVSSEENNDDQTSVNIESKSEAMENARSQSPTPSEPSMLAPVHTRLEVFDTTPVNFSDLVDEGNSFGLGGYDFTVSGPSSYGSSPSYSSSAESTSWMERSRRQTSRKTADSTHPIAGDAAATMDLSVPNSPTSTPEEDNSVTPIPSRTEVSVLEPSSSQKTLSAIVSAPTTSYHSEDLISFEDISGEEEKLS
ncbi:uncharacterized protein V1516DRAFT_680808 [Lipomyces oligophaga]|uniref:uncharacterized protein n=1 Tax=Lipomyces oligophaga TaxID=45792 RepID=UPI0034CE048B